MQRLNHGFTLLEAMVTMAVLATVAGIAIPAYKGYVHNSYTTECQNEVAAIQLAQQEFFLENNVYFPNPAGTVNSDTSQISDIETASGGFYTSGYTVPSDAAKTTANLAKANCLITVTSITAPAPSYTITVVGQNNLTASDTYSFTK